MEYINKPYFPAQTISLSAEVRPTCHGCLNTDRKIEKIEEFWSRQCYNQIISETPIIHTNGLPITLCWQCAALLHKFTRFKHQVLQSYKVLQDLKKADITTSNLKLSQLLEIQNVVNIAIVPNTNYPESLFDKEEFTVETLKTENFEEKVRVKEENNFSDDDDDRTLIEIAEKKGVKCRTKKRKKKGARVEQTDIYREVELTREQLEEDRRLLEAREDYINAMFRCERCIISFPNVDDLNDHVNLKHDLNASNLKCAICECSFANEFSYSYHMNKHTKRYQCVVCEERCNSKRAATKHYEMVHCHGNDLKIDKQEDLHTNDILKPVDNSQEKSSKQDQDPRFPCELCPKTFRWKTSLRKHLETHRIETGQKRKPYCEPCKLTFATTSNLQKHVKTSSKHQIKLKLRKLNESEGAEASGASLEQQVRVSVNGARALHACAHCGARYQWRGNLRRHLHAHAARAKGELVCEPCNRNFSSIATYQQHMKISKKHVSENDFKFMCSECGKKFANKTRLKDHVNWEHLKNYIHTCQTCQKVFKSHTSLYLHKQVVHKKDNAEHLCDHCGKPFPNQAKLRSHITALHSGEAPYRCTTCGARFSWHSCLSRHVRRVHRKRHLT